MDPENTQKTDENSNPPTPPPYMPPIESVPSVEPPKQAIDDPTESMTPPTVTTPTKLNLKTEVPAWGWAVAAVVIVGILGFVGWRIYMVNEANRMIAESNRSYTQSKSNIVAQQKKTTQTAQTNPSSNSTSTTNKCSETPDENGVCIGDRIWMKKNLDVGVMINSSKPQTDNDVVEKYCYDNNPLNCDTYGGLYQWDEMVQYSGSWDDGDQGICPADFHIPVDTEWDNLDKFLKFDSDILPGGASGFNALLGGYYGKEGKFFSSNFMGFFWSSTDGKSVNNALNHAVYGSQGTIYNYDDVKTFGMSVRCVKNWM